MRSEVGSGHEPERLAALRGRGSIGGSEPIRTRRPPMPMPNLPPSLTELLDCFRPCFTAPTSQTFCAPTTGLLAQPRPRTITGMLTCAPGRSLASQTSPPVLLARPLGCGYPRRAAPGAHRRPISTSSARRARHRRNPHGAACLGCRRSMNRESRGFTPSADSASRGRSTRGRPHDQAEAAAEGSGGASTAHRACDGSRPLHAHRRHCAGPTWPTRSRYGARASLYSKEGRR